MLSYRQYGGKVGIMSVKYWEVDYSEKVLSVDSIRLQVYFYDHITASLNVMRNNSGLSLRMILRDDIMSRLDLASGLHLVSEDYVNIIKSELKDIMG